MKETIQSGPNLNSTPSADASADSLPIGTGNEITERTDFMSSALNTVSAMVLVLDHYGLIVFANPAMYEIAGHLHGKLPGRFIWEILDIPEEAAQIREMFADISSGNFPARHENFWMGGENSLRVISWQNRVIRDCDDRITHVVSTGNDITEPHRKIDELRRRNNEWEEIFDTLNDAITIHDLDFNVLRANKAATELLDPSRKTIAGRKCYELYHGADCPPEKCPSRIALKTGRPASAEIFEPRLGKYVEVKALPRFDQENQLVGFVHIVLDIDARKKAEAKEQKLQVQLFQSQKMESVGQFAGGLAHDFNNILSAILGYCEIALDELAKDHPVHEYLEIINDSGQKAAALIRQLLAFSRKQVLEVVPVDLVRTVEHLAKMLARLIGEDIELRIKANTTYGKISADPGQIEQVIMNLAVNARDAMPDGGRFSIEISDIDFSKSTAMGREMVVPGRYLLLTVSDTGIGMVPEVRDMVFEPFFTTKEKGKGTGLGLAMTHGIIKQHQGYIQVDSTPGEGSVFRIYLPAADHPAAEAKKKDIAQVPQGTETILVVEDNPAIRLLTIDMLKMLGYSVLEAKDGQAAQQISASHEGVIDLLLTDVIMPGINGRKLADKVREERPNIKIVYMSGYTDDIIGRHGVLEPGINFIQKPVLPTRMAVRLREVLNSK